MEEFRDLNLPYAYQISNMGRVKVMFGVYRGLIKSQSTDKQGHAIVYIWNGKKMRPKRVFRLMLLAFLNEKRSWVDVKHLDGNKNNNKLENLEIVSSI